MFNSKTDFFGARKKERKSSRNSNNLNNSSSNNNYNFSFNSSSNNYNIFFYSSCNTNSRKKKRQLNWERNNYHFLLIYGKKMIFWFVEEL